MAMEPNRWLVRRPKAAPVKPKPISKTTHPLPPDTYGAINHGDRGDSDRSNARSHRDR